MSKARLRSALLWACVTTPLVAVGCLLLAWAAYPRFDNATQYLSELGGAKAHYPIFFNLALWAAGLGGLSAGLGFTLAVPALGGSRWAGLAVGACFLAAGIGLVVAAVFPWPDPRHNLVQLGLGIQLAPLVLLWTLWRVDGMGRLRAFLVVAAIAMLVLTVLTKHLIWPQLVNDDNVGWWERALALVLVGWGGIAAGLMERRLMALAARGS